METDHWQAEYPYASKDTFDMKMYLNFIYSDIFQKVGGPAHPPVRALLYSCDQEPAF